LQDVLSTQMSPSAHRDTEITVAEVRRFWDANPCGGDLSVSSDRLAYFAEIEEKRYRREWHIPIVARFHEFTGRRVLEVGCGIGTDGLQFARHGADYVGIDLSPVSAALAQEQFEVLGLPGTIEVADAERLNFPDAEFDHVYSFGVIHHSPHVDLTVTEIQRVLRPGGTATVMVYNRSSVNFQVEISLLRKAARPALGLPFMPRLLSSLTGFDREKLERHRQLKLERRGSSEADWVSMNTDGP
jgi:ubiquinone/menaquinone biosynthesis C-methylase UbiE